MAQIVVRIKLLVIGQVGLMERHGFVVLVEGRCLRSFWGRFFGDVLKGRDFDHLYISYQLSKKFLTVDR